MKKRLAFALLGLALVAVLFCFVTGDKSYELEDDMDDTITIVSEDGSEIILDEDVPLAASPSGSTTKKVTSKKSYSTEWLSKKSSKTKTVTKTTTVTGTKTSKTAEQAITVKTQKETKKASKYTRGSKKISITTTVKTTVWTTKSPIAVKELSIQAVAPYADAKLMSEFSRRGYVVKLDNGSSSAGLFSVTNKCITLQTNRTIVYHELGHFLAYIGGRADQAAEWQEIYTEEKGKYQGSNVDYVTKNAQEFFAECYRDYVTRKSTLLSSRPKSYAYIERILKEL